jgi:hypothetical protein
MIPVETVPGSLGGRRKEINGGGVNSSMIHLIHCKNICKCHNVPPPRTKINKEIAIVLLLTCRIIED